MELIDYRKRSSLTQQALSDLARVSRETIVRIESGTRRPSPDVAERIAKALGMDIETMWRVMYRNE